MLKYLSFERGYLTMKRSKSAWHEHLSTADFIKEFPKGSMYSYLKQTSTEHLNYCAIEFEGKKISYKKLLEQIEDVAKALVNIGIKKGDCISVISVNTPEVVLMIYAVNRIGAVANMIHPLLSSSEIENFIKTTNSSAVLVLDQIYPKLEKIKWEDEKQPKIILTKIVDSLPWHIKPIYSILNKNKTTLNLLHDTVYWNSFVSASNTKDIILPKDCGKSDDTAIIMYSGGTTGTPKGVMLTNLNLNSYAIQGYEVSGVKKSKGKKFLAILPLFHGYGFAAGIHTNLCKGVHIYLLPKFEFKKSIDLIFKEKINLIYAVPALFEALIRSDQIEKKDLSFFECLISGGDKLPARLYNKLSERLIKGNSKAVFCDGYGQTECVAACTTNPYFALNPKSVGILLADVTAKIVEPGTHDEVPNGTDGELCINGPTVMKGYYKNEEETKKALQLHDDGKIWLHTGDIFSRDDDGYFYFKQRISRMVISSGYNIYVTEVEKVINSCPAVAQSCVVGINNKVLGQKIIAHVVLNNPEADKDLVRSKILEQCKAMLPEYSIPHEIRFRDELPVTNLGKINFKVLENEK